MRPSIRAVMGLAIVVALFAAAPGCASNAAHAAPHARNETLAVSADAGRYEQVSHARTNLVYHGGPVITAPAIGLVYWGFGTSRDPDGEIPRLNDFLEHLPGSRPMDVLTQYYEEIDGSRRHVPNDADMRIATWSDDDDPLPRPHPNDAAIRREALRAAEHFSFGVPSIDTVIVVAIPHGIPMRYAACAYHGRVRGISYVNLPYEPDFGKHCGSHSVNPGRIGRLDGVTETALHEIAEAMTNPGSYGWYSPGRAEVADKCEDDAANVDFNGKLFPSQPLWSNATNDCRY